MTVKKKEDPGERDIEVPTDIPVIKLSGLIANALRWPVSTSQLTVEYDVDCQKPWAEPFRLDSRETLAQAGVWDGVRLIFYPIVSHRAAARKFRTPESDSAIVVTIKRKGENQVRDVTIPPDIPAMDVAGMVAADLGWDRDASGALIEYQIEAVQKETPGIMVPRHTTLKDAGVTDGTWLVFHPLSEKGQQIQAPRASPDSPGADAARATQADDTPVKGWRSLGIELPKDAASESNPQQEPPGEGGFIWKKLE